MTSLILQLCEDPRFPFVLLMYLSKMTLAGVLGLHRTLPLTFALNIVRHFANGHKDMLQIFKKICIFL